MYNNIKMLRIRMTSFKLQIILYVLATSVWGQEIFIGTHSKGQEQGLYKSKISELSIAKNIKQLSNKFGTTIVLHKKGSSFIYTCGVGEKQQAGVLRCYDIVSGKIIDSVSSGDLRPCYLAFSKDQKYLFVSNIKNGSVCSIELNNDGTFGPQISRIEIEPKGKRFAPHACVLSPEGEYLFVPDIAGNRICRLKFSPSTGELKYLDSISSENFTGPRHMTFDKQGLRAYLVNQMGEAITVFNYKDGNLIELENIQSLPNDQLEINNHIAEIKIHPSGKFVYASNRGHNSLALFQRDTITGLLRFDRCFSSGGESPWSFAISTKGDYLYCTNNKSHNLVTYKIDQDNGFLERLALTVRVPNPASVIIVD